MSETEPKEIREVELLWEAPKGHKDKTMWVSLSEIIVVGLPYDPEDEKVLDFQDKVRIVVGDDEYVYYKYKEFDPTEEFEDIEDEDLEKCERCNKDFPAELIKQTVSSEGNFTSCPICALKERNKVHGMPKDAPFSGELASLLYGTAVQWLKFRGEWDNKDGLPE